LFNKTKSTSAELEDPGEFSHSNKKYNVSQRDIGINTSPHTRALRASLRKVPDVILIDKIRDRKTIEAALKLTNTATFLFRHCRPILATKLWQVSITYSW
jgi:Tfp pilus assembly pilus retraction ATPase PilT